VTIVVYDITADVLALAGDELLLTDETTLVETVEAVVTVVEGVQSGRVKVPLLL